MRVRPFVCQSGCLSVYCGKHFPGRQNAVIQTWQKEWMFSTRRVILKLSHIDQRTRLQCNITWNLLSTFALCADYRMNSFHCVKGYAGEGLIYAIGSQDIFKSWFNLIDKERKILLSKLSNLLVLPVDKMNIFTCSLGICNIRGLCISISNLMMVGFLQSICFIFELWIAFRKIVMESVILFFFSICNIF